MNSLTEIVHMKSYKKKLEELIKLKQKHLKEKHQNRNHNDKTLLLKCLQAQHL